MTREIEFRAWLKNDKVMTGKVLQITDNPSVQYIKFDKIENWKGNQLNNPTFADLRDVVLMQYTGLKDKNGKEIFEGDIVKFINPMPIEAKEEIAEVKFVLEDSFLPYIYPFVNISSYNYETKHFEGFGINSKDCEVIGDIYENPELLGFNQRNTRRAKRGDSKKD